MNLIIKNATTNIKQTRHKKNRTNSFEIENHQNVVIEMNNQTKQIQNDTLFQNWKRGNNQQINMQQFVKQI